PVAVERAPPPSTAAARPTVTPDKPSAPEGETIVDARYDAAYLNNPPPPYPSLSRRMRAAGKVLLRVFVDSEGRPEQVSVKTSSGSTRLDEAARSAVARWRFAPAKKGDKNVAAWVIVPIVFRLEG